MKKILLLALLLLAFGCENNDEECEDLYQQYLNSIPNAGGSQTALDELTRQYNEKKEKLGCN